MLCSVFSHFLYSSLIAGILIILILAMKKVFHNRLSVRFYNMLWLLVLIRLLMPFQIETPFNIANLFPIPNHIISNYDFIDDETGDGNNLEQMKSQRNSANKSYDFRKQNDTQPFQLTFTILAKIWLLGFLSFALAFLIFVINFKYRAKTFKKVTDPELQLSVKQCCDRLHIKNSIPVYMDKYIKSPCIAGLISPGIYLPEDICDKIPLYQLQLILLHELVHYKRKDLLCNLLTILALCMHWFNPLVWLAAKEMKYDREIASDTCAMEVIGENGVIPYGMSIINMSSLFSIRQRQFNLINFNETTSQVERRIYMIKNFKKGSYKISAIAFIIFIGIAAVTLTQFMDSSQATNPVVGTDTVLSDTVLQETLVVIDPAHGGNQLGAIFPNLFPQEDFLPDDIEVMEKDLNLDISLKLYNMLKESGINVEMTRQEDTTMTPKERVDFANSLDASLIVCIHAAAHPDNSRNGTITHFLHSNHKSPYGITEERVAQLVQEELVKQLGTTDLGLCKANFTILRDTKMPAVLTEVAYISNESDRKNLMTEEFRTKAAQALHDSIINVLEEMVQTESDVSEDGK